MIERVAGYSFRREPRWRCQELISDVVALAYVAFVRLVERGKTALAFPTVLADHAVRQIRDGRQIGSRRNSQDVLSPFAQRCKGLTVEPLHKRDAYGEWQELADGRRANPADVAACRIDFVVG
jgi:hypothetical protein